MISDYYIDRTVGKHLLKLNEDKRKAHISSGKLSASMLGQPLQWQILKILGIEPKKTDEYTVRKFLRGIQIEEWLVCLLEMMEVSVTTQKPVEYRNTVGLIDVVASTHGWDWEFAFTGEKPLGVIPVEVKSVANAKFKRILKQGPDKSHLLQACLYALAEGKEHFAIVYVAADDLRIHTFIEKTADHTKNVDEAINDFQAQLATGRVPVFIPKEPWQSSPKYNNYPEWQNLTAEEIEAKLKTIKK